MSKEALENRKMSESVQAKMSELAELIAIVLLVWRPYGQKSRPRILFFENLVLA